MIRRFCLAVLAALGFMAIAVPAAAEPSACRQDTPETFTLAGPTDATLAACVKAAFQPTTRTVIVDSIGGDVANALDIAELFEDRRLTFRVRNKCNSSCANYFLPLAGRIELEPGAFVLLHGSIDPWTVDRVRTETVEAWRREGVAQEEISRRLDRPGFAALLSRQAEFAARNGVHPGWLLYRDVGSSDVRGLNGLTDATTGKALLVEEAMMRSCLPNAEIVPYQADLDRRWARRARFNLAGIRSSGEARCVAPQPAE